MKKWMSCAVALMVVAAMASATSITNAVEKGEGWTNLGGGWFSATAGGLTAEAGAKFWQAIGSENNRGAWKLFSDTFATEELQVTYFVGDRNDRTLVVPGASLFADTNEDNLYQFTERITPDSTSRPAPASGWEEWVDTYTIDATTQTVGGDSVLGKKIGFVIVKKLEGGGTGYAFDSLSIIPEPAGMDLSI